MSGNNKLSYPMQLRDAIRQYLPQQGVPLLTGDARVRWTPRLLVVGAVLMAWDVSQSLKDRFACASATLGEMYPSRRRCGQTYQGFIAALAQSSGALLEGVTQGLRRAVRRLAGSDWEVCGWAVFGCDSTKIDCPMTAANEQALNCASKKKSWPQQLLTSLLHVGTGLPWAFVRGAASASERQQLLAMLHLLPDNALLLADAGFTGYDLLKAILDSGRSFVIRVGSNVRLLSKLGFCAQEHDGIVYLWPHDKQKRQCEPLVLRLVRFTDGRNRTICLLSNVLDQQRLSDSQALRMYCSRWGVELLFRAMKQTLARRKMLSDSPAHARVELDWSLVGLWLLGLMSVRQQCLAGHPPARWSAAQALRVVRDAMQARARRRGTLAQQLALSVKDNYPRSGVKNARHWPHKKRPRAPGQPQARMATPQEVQLATELREKKAAA